MNILIFDQVAVRGEDNATAIQSAASALGIAIDVYYCQNRNRLVKPGAYSIDALRPDKFDYIILHNTNKSKCAEFLKPTLMETIPVIRYTGGYGYQRTSGTEIWIQRPITETETITKDEARAIIDWCSKQSPKDDIPAILGGEDFALVLLSALLSHRWSIETSVSERTIGSLLDGLDKDEHFPHGLTLDQWPPVKHQHIWKRLELVFERNSAQKLPPAPNFPEIKLSSNTSPNTSLLRNALHRLATSDDEYCDALTELRKGLLGS